MGGKSPFKCRLDPGNWKPLKGDTPTINHALCSVGVRVVRPSQPRVGSDPPKKKPTRGFPMGYLQIHRTKWVPEQVPKKTSHPLRTPGELPTPSSALFGEGDPGRSTHKVSFSQKFQGIPPCFGPPLSFSHGAETAPQAREPFDC